MEEFFSFLESRFPAERFQTKIQTIPKSQVRTTDRNFIVTVPGKSPERLILVAHYDTWSLSGKAPGADDNTSGEEVLKHYLLRDLCSGEKPPLTHTYLFSGSEECGNRGLISQFGLIVFLSLISYALSSANPVYLLVALPFLPLVNYRFGITGTSHFVKNLPEGDKESIQAAIAVDAVGEGRLYILENEMGANFLRALFPYEGSESLNDLLEEGAHLNGIKFNRFLSGGTTDSVAFLEERKPLPSGRGETHIPAAANLTMAPGKCSPFIWGGKLHTKNDTPDRVYPVPLGEVLTVLDYAMGILQGGQRTSRPRDIGDHHYVRLYRDGSRLFIAMKDAIEHNRRNINTIFEVEGKVEGAKARVRVRGVLHWGVETRLDREMNNFRPRAEPVPVDSIEVETPETRLRFEASGNLRDRLRALAIGSLAYFERMMGRYSFMAMFAVTLLVGFTATELFEWAVDSFPSVGRMVAAHFVWAFIAMLLLQIALLARLFSRELPTWMDNAYRNENLADNLTSLSRTSRVNAGKRLPPQ
ncbi:MAG: M28 family peptidase [Thermodesulfovibrionales bacterium]